MGTSYQLLLNNVLTESYFAEDKNKDICCRDGPYMIKKTNPDHLFPSLVASAFHLAGFGWLCPVLIAHSWLWLAVPSTRPVWLLLRGWPWRLFWCGPQLFCWGVLLQNNCVFVFEDCVLYTRYGTFTEEQKLQTHLRCRVESSPNKSG